MKFSEIFWIPKIEKLYFITSETTTYNVFDEYLDFPTKNLYPRVLLQGEFNEVIKIKFLSFFDSKNLFLENGIQPEKWIPKIVQKYVLILFLNSPCKSTLSVKILRFRTVCTLF